MRLLLALALWCGLVASAQAQSAQQFLGYTWPNANESIHCSPTCTGASVEFNVPTFSGGSVLYQWVGINANGLGSVCPVLGGCLGQFGVEWTGSALRPWYEFACTGGAGCGPVTPITGITISVGDTIKLTMLCTVACNGSDSEQWAFTLADLTTNTTCYVVTTGTHCGTSGDTLNWPLSNVNQIFYVFETDNADTWTPSARWSNATVTTGLPGSQTTINAPLSPAQASYLVGTGSGTGKTSSPSGPIGVNGNDFTFCAPITSASYNPCSASGYGASVMGP